MNKKITFTTIIAMTALLCTQKSSASYDIIRNRTDKQIQVILHTPGKVCTKLTVDNIAPNSTRHQPAGSQFSCNKPSDRTSLEIKECEFKEGQWGCDAQEVVIGKIHGRQPIHWGISDTNFTDDIDGTEHRAEFPASKDGHIFTITKSFGTHSYKVKVEPNVGSMKQ